MLNYRACREGYKCVLFTSLVARILFQVSNMNLVVYLGDKRSLIFSHPLVYF